MNDKLLVETAVLAGEVMLVSGAEIYRVEDTIKRILQNADRRTSEAIVLSTGIFVTLNDPELEPITVIRRVTDRSTNLNKALDEECRSHLCIPVLCPASGRRSCRLYGRRICGRIVCGSHLDVGPDQA